MESRGGPARREAGELDTRTVDHPSGRDPAQALYLAARLPPRHVGQRSGLGSSSATRSSLAHAATTSAAGLRCSPDISHWTNAGAVRCRRLRYTMACQPPPVCHGPVWTRGSRDTDTSAFPHIGLPWSPVPARPVLGARSGTYASRRRCPQRRARASRPARKASSTAWGLPPARPGWFPETASAGKAQPRVGTTDSIRWACCSSSAGPAARRTGVRNGLCCTCTRVRPVVSTDGAQWNRCTHPRAGGDVRPHGQIRAATSQRPPSQHLLLPAPSVRRVCSTGPGHARWHGVQAIASRELGAGS
jgi:hypothetical protein